MYNRSSAKELSQTVRWRRRRPSTEDCLVVLKRGRLFGICFL